jgi:hypothetical protein
VQVEITEHPLTSLRAAAAAVGTALYGVRALRQLQHEVGRSWRLRGREHGTCLYAGQVVHQQDVPLERAGPQRT